MSKTSLVAPTKFRNFRAGNVEVTGGILSEDATYYYHTFKSSGTLGVAGGSIVADIFTVAGGGGGGDNGSGGGGGGAGGIYILPSQILNANNHSVIVGAGGIGAIEPAVSGQGNTSTINSLTAAATGGRGGSGGGNAAGSGASGGGAGGNSGLNGGGGTPGQGNQGGYGNAGQYAGGGGGGFGSAGGAGASNNGGAGGSGTNSFSTWTTPTGVGVSGYLAGGGGGGSASVGMAGGAGGSGGGGNGGVRTTTYPTAGTANTGSGGGAGGGGSAGAAGGSGLVIVRYPKTAITSTFADYELIGTINVTSTTATVTFSGIPQGYKHLQIRGAARSDVASGYVDTRIKFNGDTTAGNYSTHEVYGTGTSAASGGAGSYYPPGIAYSAGSSSATNIFSAIMIDIPDYVNTSKVKVARCLSGVSGASNLIDMRSVSWYQTLAITTLELNTSGNFVAGSTFSLFGIRG